MNRSYTIQEYGNRIYDRLGSVVSKLVRTWRRFDSWLNQPLPTGRGLGWRYLAPDGQPWFVSALALALIAATALGPAFSTGATNLALLALGYVLLLVLHVAAAHSTVINRFLLAGHLAIMSLLLVLILVSSRPETFGAPRTISRLHLGIVILPALVIALTVVRLIARKLFRPGANWQPALALSNVELFIPNSRYDFAGQGPVAALISALVIAPIRYPVEILLGGSLLSLFVPDHYLHYAFYSLTMLSWFVVFLGILFERLMEILRTLGRLFFIGPQRVISILVIIIAVLRLFDVHYITYLFNTGSGGFGNVAIMRYIALAYVTAWYYAFWCDIFVARRMVRLLWGSDGPMMPAKIPYDFQGDESLSTVSNVGRFISIHGAGRIKIVGTYEGESQPGSRDKIAIQFMSPADLLGQFRTQLERLPSSKIHSSDVVASIRNFQRSTVVYPVIVGLFAYLLIGAPTLWAFIYAVQPPELSVKIEPKFQGMPLDSLLFDYPKTISACPPLEADSPRIALVASGGGTRAALYTASLLYGLAKKSWICNVVVASGVSGGSAAIAYFALHEKELRRPGPPDDQAWKNYLDTMALPYIEYAIDGASDARITFGRWRWAMSTCDEMAAEDGVTGWKPARSRLGSILAEAFVCKMGAAKTVSVPFGIMFNTAMVGSFPEANRPCKKDNPLLSIAERAALCRGSRDATKAGGRLVLTNLVVPYGQEDPHSRQMQIVTINNPDVSIARAAALSANFPPVFPDAVLDVVEPGDNSRRYWVTDGGAVENRGAMTLYFAIRDALERSLFKSGHKVPPLHVIIADVSASAGLYSESFGLGSVLGAGGQLGLGLEAELGTDIEELYKEHQSHFIRHEIAMPPLFTGGGIGTHWLLPSSLSFSNSAEPSESQVLTAAEVKRLVLALHSEPSPAFNEGSPLATVRSWAGDPNYSTHDFCWLRLLSLLSQFDERQLDGKCHAAAQSHAVPQMTN